MTRPVSTAFDRPFEGWSTVFAATRVRTPPVEAIRAVLADLMADDPASPPALEIREGQTWRRAGLDPEALAERLVVQAGPLAPGPDVSADLARRAEHEPPLPPGLPFRLSVGPDHFVATSDHLIGDGSVTTPLVTGPLLAAAGDSDALADLRQPTSNGLLRPVLTTLVRTLRRLPRLVLDELPSAAQGEWRLQHGVAHLVLEAEANRVIKSESRRLGVRRTSLVIALIERSLAAHRLGPTDDVRTVVVDCRRYLRAGQVVRGNFSAGTALAARWADAQDVDGRLDFALNHARPLLHLVASAVGTRRKAGRTAEVVRPPAPGAPVRVRPDYSVVGPARGTARLDWDGPKHFLAATRPHRPDAFGVIAFEVGASMQVTVSFDRGFIEPAAVHEVLETFRSLVVAQA